MKFKPYPLPYLVIVGTGETAWDFVKRTWANGQFWKHNGGELWGINDSGYSFRCDKVWSAHDNAMHEGEFKRLEEDKLNPTYLRDLPEVPVVVLEETPKIPNQLIYPLEEVYLHYNRPRQFQNTLCYMLAFAGMCEGLKDIWLYGTDFNRAIELEHVSVVERHTVRYWIGRLAERGITIHLPTGSSLAGDDLFYGFTEQPKMSFSELETALGA